jgi:outer membrane protein OmpA-like peptidoglycan-associated protein
MEYRITGRGKLVLSALIILIVAVVSYAAGYFAGERSPVASLPSSVAEGKTSDAPVSAQGQDSAMSQIDSASIFFGGDSQEIGEDARKELLRLSRAINSHGGRLLVVLEGSYNGYPDNDGEYFDGLAIMRAMSAKKELQGMVEGDVRIMATSIGKSRQMNDGNSRAELAKNRRVDVTVYVLGK